MALIAVLIQPTTTKTIMNSTAPNTITNNALSLSNRINGSTSSHFGVYQQTLVGTSDVSIRTLVSAAISATPHRKALIAKLFFLQILALNNALSVSFRNLMTTVASYFSLNTSTAEREAKTTVKTIRSNLFPISNLKGAAFADASRKPIAIPDPDKHSADLTYFNFRSVLSAVAVDARAPDKILSIEFSLRLPQTLVYLSPSTGLPVTATVDTSTIAKPPAQRRISDFSSVIIPMTYWMRSGWMICVFSSLKIETHYPLTSLRQFNLIISFQRLYLLATRLLPPL